MKHFVTLLFLTGILHGYSQTDKRLNGIEKDLEKILKVTMAPSFAVAVVQGDKIVYAQGFGYRDYENKIEADAIYTKGDILHPFIQGKPEYELIATDKYKFYFKYLEGYKLEFIESNKGKVNEVKIIQRNGTFTARR